MQPDQASDMTEKEILALFEKEYIENGYIYSGSIPQNGRIFYCNKANFEKALKLVDEGKLEFRQSESRSFELPKQRRKELIEEHGLTEKWQQKAPYFYPNGPYGEVTLVYDRTKEVLKANALARLHQSKIPDDVWFAYINGHDGRGPYKVQYWQEDYKQFKKGQITCECKSWIFSKQPKTCRHCVEMRELLVDAQIIEG